MMEHRGLIVQAASVLLLSGLQEGASIPLGDPLSTTTDINLHSTTNIKSYRSLVTQECTPTGGSVAEGCDVLRAGCCDLFAECTDDGTCSFPSPGCTPDSCEEPEVCAAGSSCVPRDAADLRIDNDITSPYIGVLTYDSKDFFLVGEKDESGIATRLTEAITYSAELDVSAHIIFDESGVARSAYFDGRDEVVNFVYDADGVLISATEEVDDSPGRRRLHRSEVAEHYSSMENSFRNNKLLRSLSAYDDCVENCTSWKELRGSIVLGALYCGGFGARLALAGPWVGFAAGALCSIIAGWDMAVDIRDCIEDCRTPAPMTPPPTTPPPTTPPPTTPPPTTLPPTTTPPTTPPPTTPPPMTPPPTTPPPTTTPPPVTPPPMTPPPMTPPTPPPAPTPACPNGDSDCGEPHMQGLRGQRIDWSGVDGGWYSLIKDENADLHINVRLTAPLPDEFPDRQLMTSLAVLSEGHSLAIEVKNPYTIDTNGCPDAVSPCLANGGLRTHVDGQEVDEILRFSRQVPVADGAMTLSASNLPVECRQFGGDRIWARMYQEMLDGRRQLRGGESLEEWILRYDSMAAPGWCAKYIAEKGLADLQSNHAIFKIETPTVTVRLNAGINYQGDGELDWDGRVLPDLEFWQMDVGIDGLDVDNPALSGLLGETARPVHDEDGKPVMEGFDAFRGTVEDYRVPDALGVHFPLLDKKEADDHE